MAKGFVPKFFSAISLTTKFLAKKTKIHAYYQVLVVAADAPSFSKFLVGKKQGFTT